MEWYDPKAITTKNGSLKITLSENIANPNHGMNYTGGLMSTWNKFCFTGGILEASVTLPGVNNVVGLWPALWAMGNLGRAGYGASLEGMVSTFLSPIIVKTDVLRSGLTPMIRVMSGQCPIRPSMDCRRRRQSMATNSKTVSCLSCLVSVFRGARVPVLLIPVRCTRMALMLDGLLPKSTCSRPRLPARRSLAKYPSPGNGAHSTLDIFGSTPRPI
jgi:hypothetical protein